MLNTSRKFVDGRRWQSGRVPLTGTFFPSFQLVSSSFPSNHRQQWPLQLLHLLRVWAGKWTRSMAEEVCLLRKLQVTNQTKLELHCDFVVWESSSENTTNECNAYQRRSREGLAKKKKTVGSILMRPGLLQKNGGARSCSCSSVDTKAPFNITKTKLKTFLVSSDYSQIKT